MNAQTKSIFENRGTLYKGTVTHGRQFTFALSTTVLSAHGVNST